VRHSIVFIANTKVESVLEQNININKKKVLCDFTKVIGLCGLVVRVSGYRSRAPGSIPSVTRFSEKS
jgi:hypothetical protein